MKAILVGDMPESCEECSVFYRTPGDFGCGVSSHHLMDWTVRPGWCPLRPLPDKATPENSDMGINWNLGWNACLEAITGGNHDETEDD